MANVPKALQLISGGEVTPEQVQRVQAIAHTLDISSNDPLFPLLIALDTYHGVFSSLPERMSASAKTVVDATTQRAGDRAKINIDDAIAKAIIGMTGALNEASRDVVKKVANDVATKERTKWLVGSLAVACFMFAGFGWFMHSNGYDSGKNEAAAANAWMTTSEGQSAQSLFRDSPEIAAWAGTKEAKKAFALSKSGELAVIVNCDRPGWEVEKNEGKKLCVPRADPTKGQYGWYMP